MERNLSRSVNLRHHWYELIDQYPLTLKLLFVIHLYNESIFKNRIDSTKYDQDIKYETRFLGQG